MSRTVRERIYIDIDIEIYDFFELEYDRHHRHIAYESQQKNGSCK
jgi:hypothetical protein